MPSPFPGIDPFIESQKWTDFHSASINMIRELLAPQVADRYVVNIEERISVETALEDEMAFVPDVHNAETSAAGSIRFSATSVATLIEPVECLLPDDPCREGFLEIRTTHGNRLITVIELLSPMNKVAEAKGRGQYLRKRSTLLETSVNLVEIDLLRGGFRLPMRSPLPHGDYYALVSRGRRRPKSTVYAWRLPDRMPSIPIPLSHDEPEPLLDLQNVLNLVYDRGFYRLSLKYDQPLLPPFSEAEEHWLKSIRDAKSTTPNS